MAAGKSRCKVPLCTEGILDHAMKDCMFRARIKRSPDT